jgi:plastocyanin
MKALCILLLAAAAFANAQAGTIAGVVRAQGKEEVEAASGKYDSRKFKFVERINYAELRDFVVYIDEPPTRSPAPPNGGEGVDSGARVIRPSNEHEHVQVVTTKRIAQKGAVFLPHVLPVVVGTTVEWPNQDDIFHNVFSISDAKPFDLGLYKHPEVKRVTFDKPGRVDVFCSIHTAMNCIILVLPTDHFAAADDKGRYAIGNVPAGTYKLKAWHERLPSQVKEVVVSEGGEVKVDFTLGIVNLPKY